MKNRIAFLGILSFVIHPITGFLLSLLNIRSKSTAIVYISFAMLFGYSISFADSSSDSSRYAEAFSNFDNTLNFDAILTMYRSGELRDLFRLLLFYFVSLFTNNPKVMYAIAGLIFGIFSYLSLRIFVKESEKKLDFFIFILAIIFYTLVSLTNINGFRFNTGAVLLFYSTYQLIIQKKNGWLIGILITPYFHYGFILIVPVYITYKFIESFLYSKENVKSILLYLFVIAFSASWFLKTNSISLGFLSNTDVISGAVANRVEFINSSDVANLVENRKENSLFLSVQKYFDFGIKIYVFFSIFLIKDLISRMTGDKTEYTKLFALVLFLYILAFIAVSFPSGARFLAIAHLFLILLLGKLYSIYQENDLKRVIILALPVFSFQIAFINFMAPSMFLSSTFWYGNLFWIIIEGWGFTS
jgi:hypothetical protein